MIKLEQLENKYIELLLKRCINFDKSKSLFINYDKVNKNFIDKIISVANKMGIYDIYLDEEDINITHEKLSKLSLEEIEKDPYFNKSKWDECALKNASFLMLNTEFPNIMNDIDPEKVSKSAFIKRKTRSIFRKKETLYEIPWCIACLPNEIWANDLFPNTKNAYQKLFKIICDMCMIDDKNPIENWEHFIKKQQIIIDKLNSLEIKSLHYTNSLGTNLTIGMHNNYVWFGASEHIKDNMLVNMPSYEVFTTPDYKKTNGIVYSTKPLIYNDGIIDEFYLKFKNGKVIEYNAKIGKEILQGILESEEQALYLGEIALVENNSPISNTNILFGNSLFDENASCHLALGDGFETCIKSERKLTQKELLDRGINQSIAHVDFMIGNKDLNIEAETNKGKILIFKNGNFNKDF